MTGKPEQLALCPDLEQSLCYIRETAAYSADLIINRVTVGGIPCALLCSEGMFSTTFLSEMVWEPINQISQTYATGTALLDALQNHKLLGVDRKSVERYDTLFHLLHSGFAILLADGAPFGLATGLQGYVSRSIGEPTGERNLFGGKDGFTETLRLNLSLIRRRMKSPQLTFQMLQCGTLSKTDLCICYLQDRVPKDLLDQIRQALKNIPAESVLSGGYIRPYLEESDTHLFHSIGTTERPDVFCAKLLEGRVGILIDSTPFALVIPQLFCEPFQTLDDYSYNPVYVTLVRWLKYLAFFVAVLLPAVYLAIAVWHPELMHRTLLHLLLESEQTAPFSIATELLGVLFMYEILREADLRLPKSVGGAVSIIGGLIIGDAAVSSGLISTPVLTVAALSVTAGFVIPNLHQALTLLRPAFVLAAACGGLCGIALLGVDVLLNTCATEVYGFPITAPIAPFYRKGLRDVVTRLGFRRLVKGNFRVEEVRAHDKH